MSKQMAELFHRYLHALESVKDDQGHFFTWIEHFLTRDFSASFWLDVIIELAKCNKLNKCARGLFHSLRCQCGVEKDAALVAQFEELFVRGFFEHLAGRLAPGDIRRVFAALFEQHEQLKWHYQQYYPPGEYDKPRNRVPSLTGLARWHIRQKLLNENYIIFESEIPPFIYAVLNHFK